MNETITVKLHAEGTPTRPLPLGEGWGEGDDHGARDLRFSGWRGRHDR